MSVLTGPYRYRGVRVRVRVRIRVRIRIRIRVRVRVRVRVRLHYLLVHRVTHHVQDAAERGGAGGNHDGRARVHTCLPTDKAFSGFHGNGAHLG